MPSKVDIINRALLLLGQEQITTLSSNEPGSAVLTGLFQPMFDEVARSIPFRCLTKRANVAASATAPEWGFSYAYPLPPDCLALLDVYTDGGYKLAEWILEGGSILCNAAGPLLLRYTKSSEDPNEWDALLQSTIAYRLAVEVAELLTDSTALANSLTQRYQAMLKQAASRSSKEALPTRITQPDSWEAVRWSSSGISGRGEAY